VDGAPGRWPESVPPLLRSHTLQDRGDPDVEAVLRQASATPTRGTTCRGCEGARPQAIKRLTGVCRARKADQPDWSNAPGSEAVPPLSTAAPQVSLRDNTPGPRKTG